MKSNIIRPNSIGLLYIRSKEEVVIVSFPIAFSKLRKKFWSKTMLTSIFDFVGETSHELDNMYLLNYM